MSKPERLEPDNSLPVRVHTNEILKALSTNDVLILVAETGSGKTTQIPQIILDNFSSATVLVTQPRRVAAISVARRVALERAATVGEHVGYAVRFDDKSQRGVTRIRYVTDGVMLREALSAGITGLHNRYSHIVIDEVHERSVNTDLVLGILKRMLTHVLATTNKSSQRQSFSSLPKLKMSVALPFKVVLMSATTDAEKLRAFFTTDTNLKVGMLNIEGKVHDVRVLNATKPVQEFVDSSVETCLSIITKEKTPGDILVFLPGQDDIINATSLLRKQLRDIFPKDEQQRIYIHALFSAMTPEDQLRPLQPLPAEHRENGRKVIFATNIAETSITIPGIKFVIDSGLMKVRECYSNDVFKGDVLQLKPVSKAQADQRKGRAGRTGPGVLYRLYTNKQYEKLKPYPTPEILRSEATGTLLQIIALVHLFEQRRNARKEQQQKTNENDENDENGNQLNFRTFPLLDSIPMKETEFGLETLQLLGAVDGMMRLTETGELMSRLPVNPMLARSLLESLRLGCVEAMVTVAATLSVDGLIFLEAKGSKREKILTAQRRFVNLNGDQLTHANVLHAIWQVMKPSKRLEKCKEHYLNYRTVLSAISIRSQLLKIMQNGDMISWGKQTKLSDDVENDVRDAGMDELVRRCLVAGYFRNVAQRQDERRYMAIGRGGFETGGNGGSKGDIHPSSVLMRLKRKRQSEFLLYDELVSTTKPYFRTVTVIEPRWLSQHSSYFK